MEVTTSHLHVELSLDGVNSLAEADLRVGERTLELRLPGARTACVLELAAAVDAAQQPEAAKFSRKTGRLKLSLPLAAAALS